MRSVHIVLTCEHAGNQVPKAFQYLFVGSEKVLDTHEGWDIGALSIAQKFSDDLRAKLFETSISRLMIDCNRSYPGGEVFSKFSETLKGSVKDYLVDSYYRPYRKKVTSYISNHCKRHPVLHISVHTFTPFMHHEERLVDIGLLYDESRYLEKRLCETWKDKAEKVLPDKLIMHNVPYQGASDGFTRYLRNKFNENQYLGIEIEINQKWNDTAEIEQMTSKFIDALEASILETSFLEPDLQP